MVIDSLCPACNRAFQVHIGMISLQPDTLYIDPNIIILVVFLNVPINIFIDGLGEATEDNAFRI